MVSERKRPAFPPFAPAAYVELTAACWAHSPEQRPAFETILDSLAAMRAELPGPAAPLSEYRVGSAPPPNVSGPASGAALPKLGGADAMQTNPMFDNGSTGASGLRGGDSGGGRIVRHMSSADKSGA